MAVKGAPSVLVKLFVDHSGHNARGRGGEGAYEIITTNHKGWRVEGNHQEDMTTN